jgi:hypothetical protein
VWVTTKADAEVFLSKGETPEAAVGSVDLDDEIRGTWGLAVRRAG